MCWESEGADEQQNIKCSSKVVKDFNVASLSKILNALVILVIYLMYSLFSLLVVNVRL